MGAKNIYRFRCVSSCVSPPIIYSVYCLERNKNYRLIAGSFLRECVPRLTRSFLSIFGRVAKSRRVLNNVGNIRKKKNPSLLHCRNEFGKYYLIVVVRTVYDIARLGWKKKNILLFWRTRIYTRTTRKRIFPIDRCPLPAIDENVFLLFLND